MIFYCAKATGTAGGVNAMGMYCYLYSLANPEAESLLDDPDRIEEFLDVQEEDGTSVLSLEKSWHGLNFILSSARGHAPLDFFEAGQPVGDVDLGYGPAHIFTAEEVKAIAAVLQVWTEAEFDEQFDPAAMAAAQIYPLCWDEPRETLLEEYQGYFVELKAFIHQAAQTDQAIAIAIL